MGGGGSGNDYISVGGVTVQISTEYDAPYIQEIQDISLCAAILQMATHINNSNIRDIIHKAATQAMSQESAQLAQKTSSAS